MPAVLKLREAALLAMDFDDLMPALKALTDGLAAADVIAAALRVPLTRAQVGGQSSAAPQCAHATLPTAASPHAALPHAVRVPGGAQGRDRRARAVRAAAGTASAAGAAGRGVVE